MKRLNKYYTESNLNLKIRKFYELKRRINNSKLDGYTKKKVMRYCDQEINKCWRYACSGAKGYELVLKIREVKTNDSAGNTLTVSCLSPSNSKKVLHV